MRKILLGGLLILGLFAPGTANATHFGGECYGDVVDAGIGRCTATFPLSGGRYLSTFETHANYHDVDGRGYFLLEWYDSHNVKIMSLVCRGVGLPGDGLTDETRAGVCEYYDPPLASYHEGTQKIVVTAYNTKCPEAACRFHGRLRLSGSGDIF